MFTLVFELNEGKQACILINGDMRTNEHNACLKVSLNSKVQTTKTITGKIT